MLISQTFRGSPELKKTGYILLQKWYMLSNIQRHKIIKQVLADKLNSNETGKDIKQALASAINQAVPNSKVPNY